MSQPSLVRRIALLLPIALLMAVAATAQKPSYFLVISSFKLDHKTEIPGHTLEPGDYSIHIVDHLKDRYILRVDDSRGKELATFIGLHNPDFASFTTAKQGGLIYWTAAPHGVNAVRGFSFPDGNALEFVYPKGQAVELAKLNTYSVPAIDPESEGRKSDPKLSPEDREVVTLWMLTSTRVGKDNTPAIDVQRFVAKNEPAPLPSPAQTAAQAAVPVQSPKTAQTAQSKPAQPVQISKLDAPPAPPQAPSRVKSPVKRLPQTASELPLLLLGSLLSLMVAGGMRFGRSQA